ncbi:hypothetical protein NFI96_026281 [Prochilodus magdalenae]|nr:hypothetical protein NFI96_026281 [Prochilodus magdalenae]
MTTLPLTDLTLLTLSPSQPDPCSPPDMFPQLLQFFCVLMPLAFPGSVSRGHSQDSCESSSCGVECSVTRSRYFLVGADKKRGKLLEESSSTVCEEQSSSSTLKGEDIQALAIRPEHLEKLRAPQPPKDSQKPRATTRVLVRKTRPPREEARPSVKAAVARPLPRDADPLPLDYTGSPGGPRFDAQGLVLPHSILGSLEDFRREMEARGEMELVKRIPDLKTSHPLENGGQMNEEKTKSLSRNERDVQGHALQHWSYHMAERRRQQNFISQLLQKPVENLLMNQSNRFREIQEQREIISRGLPTLEPGHGCRVGSEFWSVPQRFGDELSGIMATLTQTEKGHPQPITHITQPHSTRLESGTVLSERSVSRAWNHSQYLQHRQHELGDVLKEMGINQPYTSLTTPPVHVPRNPKPIICTRPCLRLRVLCTRPCPRRRVLCTRPCPRRRVLCTRPCPRLRVLCTRPCPRLRVLCTRPCLRLRVLCTRPCPRLRVLCTRPCPRLRVLCTRPCPRLRVLCTRPCPRPVHGPLHTALSPSPGPLHTALSPSPGPLHTALSPSPGPLHTALSPSPGPLHAALSPSPGPLHAALSPSPGPLHAALSPSPGPLHAALSRPSGTLMGPLSPSPSPGPLHAALSPSPGPLHAALSPSPGPLHAALSPSPGPLHAALSPSPGPLHAALSPSPGPLHAALSPSPGPLHAALSPSPGPLHAALSPSPGPLHAALSPSPGPLHVDMVGLEVVGSNQPYTSLSMERSPLLEEEEEEEKERMEGEHKENEDPLALYHDVVLDVELLPALRFGGELARWTGSATSQQGEVGVSVRLMFEAVVGERACSHLELKERGRPTAIY